MSTRNAARYFFVPSIHYADAAQRPADGTTRDIRDPKAQYKEITLAEFLSADLDDATMSLEPGYFCNLECNYCDLPIKSRTLLDWEAALPIFKTLALLGLRTIVITGGEPGIVPGFIEKVGDLSRLGVRFILLTHGLWARNYEYLTKVLSAGRLSWIVMNAKGFDRSTFSRVTNRPNLFDAQLQALANLSNAYGKSLFNRWTVKILVTIDNIAQADNLSWTDGLDRIPEIVFSLVEPYSNGIARLMPAPREIAERVKMMAQSAERRRIPYWFDGFPLCLLGEHWTRSKDAARMRDDDLCRVFVQPRSDGDYFLLFRGYRRYLQVSKLLECSRCALQRLCPGVHLKFGSLWSGELQPYTLDQIAAGVPMFGLKPLVAGHALLRNDEKS
jgi:uncharacterized Fe-S cluster-containing radical SAM superfamily protein